MFQTAGTEEYGAFHLTPSEGPLAPSNTRYYGHLASGYLLAS